MRRNTHLSEDCEGYAGAIASSFDAKIAITALKLEPWHLREHSLYCRDAFLLASNSAGDEFAFWYVEYEVHAQSLELRFTGEIGEFGLHSASLEIIKDCAEVPDVYQHYLDSLLP